MASFSAAAACLPKATNLINQRGKGRHAVLKHSGCIKRPHSRIIPLLKPKGFAGRFHNTSVDRSLSLTRATPTLHEESQDHAQSLAVLEGVREALGWHNFCDSEVTVWGQGRHLGMDVQWKIYWRPDGAFREEIVGPQLTYCWGHDGKTTREGWKLKSPSNTSVRDEGVVWEVDHSGCAQLLELDDWEVTVLCSWIKTSLWLSPHASQLLDITILEDVTLIDVDEEGGDSDPWRGTAVTLGFTGGKVKATIRLQQGHGNLPGLGSTPQHVTLSVYGSTEEWTLDNWEDVGDGVSFARQAKNYPNGGGCHDFTALGARKGGLLPDFFTVPLQNLDSSVFDYTADPAIRMQRVRSGHVLVWPEIDGSEIGPFILDTGASGLVITPQAAQKYFSTPGFGEMWVCGVGGSVKSQYRRASQLTLGPLTLNRPIFMEMRLEGIVSGCDETVAGIIGFDFFRHVVVEVPPKGSVVKTNKQKKLDKKKRIDSSKGESEIFIYPPESYQLAETSSSSTWVPLHFVACMPHVEASFDLAPEGPELFMLDSGAGGVECIFHSLGVARLGLDKAETGMAGMARVRGVDTCTSTDSTESPKEISAQPASGMQAKIHFLKWLEVVGGQRFEQVRSMIPVTGGFDLSEHTCGMLCGDLLSKCHVVYDFANRRISISEQENESIRSKL